MPTTSTAESGAVDCLTGAGTQLLHLRLRADSGDVVRRSCVDIGGKVEYAWPHASLPYLFVAYSAPDHGDGVVAVRVDPGDGTLALAGAPAPLASRPIHLTTDLDSRFVYATHNDPAGVTALRIEHTAHGAVELVPAGGLSAGDVGVFPHQMRCLPGGDRAIVVARGHSGAGPRAAAPGALHLVDLRDGRLRPLQVVSPAAPEGFNPRHVEPHPTLPLVYASLEPQNLVAVFEYDADGLRPEPLAWVPTLPDPPRASRRQLAGAIHLHPSGAALYIANRADATTTVEGVPRLDPGANSIAVLALDDPRRPQRVQDAPVPGVHARCFALDPTGRVLVAGTTRAAALGDDAAVTPPGLTVYSTSGNGLLTAVRMLPAPDDLPLWWVGSGPDRSAQATQGESRAWP